MKIEDLQRAKQLDYVLQQARKDVRNTDKLPRTYMKLDCLPIHGTGYRFILEDERTIFEVKLAIANGLARQIDTLEKE